jgi:type II secretory pathway pseudopilin PulG
MMRTAPIRRAKPSEEGYILVIVMFMLALLIISMAVALPKISADIQRDRESETMRRGLQYRRAIQLYFKKFHRYPPNLDALVKTNDIRFLRKKYLDPTTGKDDWKPIMFGQNKTPVAMGFFGQPLAGFGMGGGLAGTGPGGTPGVPGANPIAGGGNPTGAGNVLGTDASGSNNGGVDASGNPTDPNAGGNQVAGANPIAGPTFGGAGIIGVSPMSPKQSIFVYKKKDHYNEWEFLYSPLSEIGGMQNVPQPLLPGQAPGTVNPNPSPTPSPAPSPQPQQ